MNPTLDKVLMDLIGKAGSNKWTRDGLEFKIYPHTLTFKNIAPNTIHIQLVLEKERKNHYFDYICKNRYEISETLKYCLNLKNSEYESPINFSDYEKYIQDTVRPMLLGKKVPEGVLMTARNSKGSMIVNLNRLDNFDQLKVYQSNARLGVICIDTVDLLKIKPLYIMPEDLHLYPVLKEITKDYNLYIPEVNEDPGFTAFIDTLKSNTVSPKLSSIVQAIELDSILPFTSKAVPKTKV